MINRSLRIKIIIPTVIILIFLVVIMTLYSSTRFLDYTEDRLNSNITATAKGLNNHLKNSGQISKAAAVSMALRENVISAVEERNSRAIIELLTSLIALYGVDYYIITDNEGTVLARTHYPEKHGDSILGLHNVADALAGIVSTYYESGEDIKIAVCSGAPVYNAAGALIGVISAGIRLDTNEAVDRLKEQFNTEVTVFLEDVRVATTIKMNGERILGTRLYPEVAEIVMSRKEYF